MTQTSKCGSQDRALLLHSCSWSQSSSSQEYVHNKGEQDYCYALLYVPI